MIRYFNRFSSFIVLTGVLSISVLIFFSVQFPFSILLLIIIKPLFNYAFTPILKKFGRLRYCSPLFMYMAKGRNRYEIHNGTIYDFIKEGGFIEEGGKFKRKNMLYYILGLKEIIRLAEQGKLPAGSLFYGYTYYLSANTIRKLGLKCENAGVIRLILFYFDYVNLLIQFSLVNGKLTFPNPGNLRKITFTGEMLIQSKLQIEKISDLLTRLSTETKNKETIYGAA